MSKTKYTREYMVAHFSNKDNPCEFYDLPHGKQRMLVLFIKKHFIPRKTINKNAGSSYGLKHRIEPHVLGYIRNGEFKGAMLLCGYKMSSSQEQNPYFNVSSASTALNLKKDFRKGGANSMIETHCENCGEEIEGVRWPSDGGGLLCQECWEIATSEKMTRPKENVMKELPEPY